MQETLDCLNFQKIGWKITEIESSVNSMIEYRTQKFSSLKMAQQALDRIDKYETFIINGINGLVILKPIIILINQENKNDIHIKLAVFQSK